MPILSLPTERQKLGNYLGQTNLEQMLLGLQATLGADTTTFLVEQAGERLGRGTVRDWQLSNYAVSAEQLPFLLDAALGTEGHSLCRVRQVLCEGQSWQVKARLPQYEIMRTFASSAMRGILSELLGMQLGAARIRPDGLLLSSLTFSVPQAS